MAHVRPAPLGPPQAGRGMAALRFLRRLFAWYNTEHRHSGLGWMTPATVHPGDVAAVQARRAQALTAPDARHPERLAAGSPQPPRCPSGRG